MTEVIHGYAEHEEADRLRFDRAAGRISEEEFQRRWAAMERQQVNHNEEIERGK